MDVDNFKTNLKRFFSNPNTFTFLLVLVLIVIVYIIYVYMVNKAIDPVNLPYANVLIKADEEITQDKISYIKVSGQFVSTVSDSIIQNRIQILEHRVSENYQIPKNSFFYKDAISQDSNKEIETDFDGIPDGYTIFSLVVDFHKTYGCSIMPGNYIDLYFKAKDDNGKTVFKKFIKSIQVYKVRDKSFVDVFSYTEEENDDVNPKYMYFAVPDEYYKLLKTATELRTNDIELIPVPRNAGYSENPEPTEIVGEDVADFILSKSVNVSR